MRATPTAIGRARESLRNAIGGSAGTAEGDAKAAVPAEVHAAAGLLLVQGLANIVDAVMGLQYGISWTSVPFGVLQILSAALVDRRSRTGGLLALATTLLTVLYSQILLLYPTNLFGLPALSNVVVSCAALILLVKAWPSLRRS